MSTTTHTNAEVADRLRMLYEAINADDLSEVVQLARDLRDVDLPDDEAQLVRLLCAAGSWDEAAWREAVAAIRKVADAAEQRFVALNRAHWALSETTRIEPVPTALSPKEAATA